MRTEELNGFAAAGFFLWRTVGSVTQMLMLSETRDGRTVYNFIGGKREGNDEDALQTANREFKESTKGHFMPLPDFQSAGVRVWVPSSKYILFVCPYDEKEVAGAVQPPLEWINVRELGGGDRMHPFANDMLQVVRETLDGTTLLPPDLAK